MSAPKINPNDFPWLANVQQNMQEPSHNETAERFGEPISTYTRRMAIDDGILVDLMQPETAELVREAGFTHPVAMTTTAFIATVNDPDNPDSMPVGQDVQGRLWDVLWMLRHGIKTTKTPDRVHFTVLVWNGKNHDEVRLWALCGPGDTAEPVITIMLEGED